VRTTISPNQPRNVTTAVEQPDRPHRGHHCVGRWRLFGYKHFVKHGSPPTTVSAEDNSFTVTIPPTWRTSNVPHSKAYVLFLAHDPRGDMVVSVDAPKSTLQESGKSAVEMVNEVKGVIDPGGGLQPTTVDDEAALRFSYTMPESAEAYLARTASRTVSCTATSST
jgi:hypothetical protein